MSGIEAGIPSDRTDAPMQPWASPMASDETRLVAMTDEQRHYIAPDKGHGDGCLSCQIAEKYDAALPLGELRERIAVALIANGDDGFATAHEAADAILAILAPDAKETP